MEKILELSLISPGLISAVHISIAKILGNTPYIILD